MQEKEGIPLPLGPYPYYFRTMGWVTLHFNDPGCELVYLQREDYNMDVRFVTLQDADPNLKSVVVELRQEC